MSDIDIGLGVDTSEAEKDLGRFKSLITGAIAGISAGFAAIKIGEFLAKGIEDAIEAEAALAKLSNQLKISGDFSEEALRQFELFADGLERTTNVSAEAILEQSALAKAFGLTDEQTKSLVSAATELSAVTGKDLPSSVDTLIKSYNGQTRELDKTIAGVQGLTKEQLANGAAIDLINSRYSGTAAAALNTYQGAIASVSRAFEDSGKEIGKAVIGNTQLIGVIRQVTLTLDGITDYIDQNQGKINSFVSLMIDGFFGAAKGATFLGSLIERAIGGAIVTVTVPLEHLIGVLKQLSKVGGAATKDISEGLEDAQVYLDNFNEAAIKGVADNTGAFATLNDELGDIQKSLKATAKEGKKAVDAVQNNGKKIRPIIDADELEKGRQKFKQFSDDIFNITASQVEKVRRKEAEQLAEIQILKDKRIISEREYSATVVAINESAAKQITKIEEEESKKRAEYAASNPIEIFYKSLSGGALDSELSAAGISMATGFISGLQKGKDGVKQVGENIAGGIGTAIENAIGDDALFGLGGLFKELFRFTSQSSEEIKAQIKGFIEAIPELWKTLGDSGPAIAEGFIEAVVDSDFLVRLIQSATRSPALEWLGRQWGISGFESFTEKLGDFFRGIFESLESSFLGKFFAKVGEIFTNIYKTFAKLLDFIFGGIVQKIGEAITSLFNTIGTFFTNLFSSFGSFLSDIWEAIGNIGPNIVNAIENFIGSIGSFVEGIGIAIRDAFNNVFDAIGSIFEPIINAINSLVDGVKSVTGGGGGGYLGQVGGKLSSGFKNITGMAEGGVVPPGYPNDTYPAFLTSGETVTPPGELPVGNNDVVIALLAKILAKLSQPMTVNTTAELNGRALAEIILQLSRNNARLA